MELFFLLTLQIYTVADLAILFFTEWEPAAASYIYKKLAGAHYFDKKRAAAIFFRKKIAATNKFEYFRPPKHENGGRLFQVHSESAAWVTRSLKILEYGEHELFEEKTIGGNW